VALCPAAAKKSAVVARGDCLARRVRLRVERVGGARGQPQSGQRDAARQQRPGDHSLQVGVGVGVGVHDFSVNLCGHSPGGPRLCASRSHPRSYRSQLQLHTDAVGRSHGYEQPPPTIRTVICVEDLRNRENSWFPRWFLVAAPGLVAVDPMSGSIWSARAAARTASCHQFDPAFGGSFATCQKPGCQGFCDLGVGLLACGWSSFAVALGGCRFRGGLAVAVSAHPNEVALLITAAFLGCGVAAPLR
jgi:hypothetical protein